MKISLFLFFILPLFLKAEHLDSILLDNYRKKIIVYRYTKHLDSAVYYFKKALPIAVKQNDSIALFYIHKTLGDAYEHHHFIDSTLFLYEKCEQLIPKGNIKLKSFLLNDKAYTYRLLYDYDKSAELVLQAHKIAEESMDKREIASTALGVADGFLIMKMDKQTDLYFNKAITIGEESKDTGILSQAYRYYGEFLLNQHDLKRAYTNLRKAEVLSRYLNDSISMAFTWHHLADYYWKVNEHDSCFYFAKRAEAIWEERAEVIDLSAVCLQIGNYYMQLNNLKEAESYLKKSEKYALDDNYFNERLFSTFSKLYVKKGNVALAYEYLLKANSISEKIREQELIGKQAGLRIKFDADQKEVLLKKEKEQSLLLKQEGERKTQQRNMVVLVLFFVFVVASIMIFAYVKIKRKNAELKITNDALEISGEQKLLLLKEVHHRVKNNLTTLKSLFYLQAKASDSSEVKSVLEECQLRIQSMALIHQNLYEGSETGKVEFEYFLKQLFNELELSFRPVDKEVETIIKVADREVDMSIALFLGLILNELATNSFKYAFNSQTSGNIIVELIEKEGQLLVVYSDNGAGLKNGFDLSGGGFGFGLISILTQQINATITYSYINSLSTFTIEIPDER